MKNLGYNDEFKNKKNPFLGEEFLIFANGEAGGGAEAEDGDDQATPEDQAQQQPEQQQPEQQQQQPQRPEPAPLSQEEIDRWLAPDQETARQFAAPLIRDIRELTPGTRPYSPEQRSAIEEDWNQMMTEYNGVQTYVDHFTQLRNHVISDEFDPREERWRAHLGHIYRSFDNIQDIPGMDLSRRTRRSIRRKQVEEVNASKKEIARDLADIIVGLETAREIMLREIEAQMRRDFNARLDWLDQQWSQHPPAHFKGEHVKNHRKNIKRMRRQINDVLPRFFESNEAHEQRIREYGLVNQDIAMQEGLFRENVEDGDPENQVDLGTLTSRYEELEQIKRKRIDPIASQYKSEVDARIFELQELIYQINNSNLYKEDEKREAIEGADGKGGIRKTIANLRKNRDIDSIFTKALDDDSPAKGRDEDGNEVDLVITFDDGSAHTAKKGLKQQLEFLADPRLRDAERNELAKGLNEAFDKLEDDIVGTEEYLAKDLTALKDNIAAQSAGINLPRPKKQRFEVKWFAVADIQRGVEIIQEWAKRRYQRKATQRVGMFGSEVLKPLNHTPWPLHELRTLPNEFDKEVEKSEQEEVNQYKDIYANKDMWQVEKIAYETQNQDEFKACLYLLAENGRIRWDRSQLLKQIERFQDKVTFADADIEIQDIGSFYEKLKRSFGHIWDYDTFNQMKNQNSSAYDSKKQEYEQNCHEWAESAGKLNKIIDGMLQSQKELGREAKVDPILYEEIISYCIKYGKIGPEEKLYYLIQGIATGILSPDRGSVINSVDINGYPSIDWFGSPTKRAEKPTLKDVQEAAQYDLEGFYHWYHTEAMTCERVTQRVDKTLTQGNKLDHDDLTAFLAYMSESTTETMLGKNTDGFRLPLTGVQNGTISMLFYLDHMAENYGTMRRSHEEFIRFMGSFARWDAITMNRMYREQGTNFFRWDQTSYNQEPRYTGFYEGIYGRGALTARQNMETVRKYLEILDPQFFGQLFDYRRSEMDNVTAANLAQGLVARYGEDVFQGDTPTTVDTLYQSIGTVASYFVNERPDRVQAMFNAVKNDQDHKATYNIYKNRIQAAEERIGEINSDWQAGRQARRTAHGAHHPRG